MGLFWKRKSGDHFVSLNLNEPRPEKTSEKAPEEPVQTAADTTSGSATAGSPTPVREEQATPSRLPTLSAPVPVIEAVPTGAGPTPVPTLAPKRASDELPSPAPRQEAAPARASGIE